MRGLLVAEPALVRRPANLLLVAEPLQVLGRDGRPRRFRRGRWMWWFGGHEAIVSVLDEKFRSAPRLRQYRRAFAPLNAQTLCVNGGIGVTSIGDPGPGDAPGQLWGAEGIDGVPA